MTTEIQFTDPPLVPDEAAGDSAAAAAATTAAGAGTGDSAPVIVPSIEQQQAAQTKPEDGDHLYDEVAIEIGWQPKEEYIAAGNDPEKWRSAKDFIRHTPKVVNNQRGEIKGLKKSIAELQVFNERVYVAENNRLKEELAELQADRKHAIRESDVELVEQLDKQIGQLSDQISAPPPAAAVPTAEVNPVFADWLGKNEWYGTDPKMTKMAESITKKAREDGLDFESILRKIDLTAAELYPDRVGKPARTAVEPPDTVLAPSRTASDSKNRTLQFSDLPPDAQASCKRFVRQGVMSEAQYIKGYQAAL